MTVSETHVPEHESEQTARVIPFPRSAFEVETPESSPIMFPDTKTFIAALRQNGVSTETSGSEVMMLLYETLDLVPKKQELDSTTAHLANLRALRAEYEKLLANAPKGPQLTQFKSKLKLKGLSLEDIGAETLASIEQRREAILTERAPLQELTKTVEQRFAIYLEQDTETGLSGFSDKIEAIYEATDGFVAGDDLLELASNARKAATQTADKGLMSATRAFERFTRFMIFDENRIAASYEEKEDTNEPTDTRR